MATVLQHPFGTTAFGDFLRTARERRGLTLQQIANETKIPRRLLESLEHGDLGAVPAGMYQRAEIRAYAKAVGLDQTLALNELDRALGTRPPDSERHAGGEHLTEGLHHRPFLLLAMATAIAILGIVAWYGRITPIPSGDETRLGLGAGKHSAVAPAADAPLPQPDTAPVVDRGGDVPTPTQPAIAAKAETLRPQPGAIERAEAPPPPLPGLITELVVVTDPPGARVIVDGIGRGTTPLTIRYLTAGDKRVRVLKDGFPAQERTVRLAPAREATRVVIPLQTPGQ